MQSTSILTQSQEILTHAQVEELLLSVLAALCVKRGTNVRASL